MIARRGALALLAGAALTWPLAARAQQPTVPVVGYLDTASSQGSASRIAAFQEGLNEAGYREGVNVAVEYRWAEGRPDRLPALAAELLQLDVAVIFAGGGSPSAVAARAASATIPIVFVTGADPVALGLVASLSRPGGNLTGVSMFARILEPKRLGLLHELLPEVATIAVLLNPTDNGFPDQSRELAAAAELLGLGLRFFTASTESEIDAAFAAMAEPTVEALLVGANPFFAGRRDQIVRLAAERGIPAIHAQGEFAKAGGLMSYGANLAAAYRLGGVDIGRILNGERPADMPVVQADTFELVINLRAAAALGITVPPSLMLAATELLD